MPTTRVSSKFVRPSDTTAYAVGDLVANSTTADVVRAMQFSILPYGGQDTAQVLKAKLAASNTSLTNAEFRLHLYTENPYPTNGDNGAWLTSKVDGYIGSLDIVLDKAFADGANGFGYPGVGSQMMFNGNVLYGLLEARAAYTPASAQTFTVTLECDRGW